MEAAPPPCWASPHGNRSCSCTVRRTKTLTGPQRTTPAQTLQRPAPSARRPPGCSSVSTSTTAASASASPPLGSRPPPEGNSRRPRLAGRRERAVSPDAPCSRRCSDRPGPRCTGPSLGGAGNGSGPGCIGSCSTNSVPGVSLTGRGAQSTRSVSELQREPLAGPTQTARGKLGSKIRLITDCNGLPLSLGVSGANMHDSLGLKPLVRGIPPIRSCRGPRRRRPVKLHADKGYDCDHLRRWLRSRGIRHRIARKGVGSSQRFGRHRWVVERTVSWLAGC